MGGPHFRHGALPLAEVVATLPLALKSQKVVCLEIPDNYEYMDRILQELLKRKVLPHLGGR
jgi:predicted protein tyrosine phosphatase